MHNDNSMSEALFHPSLFEGVDGQTFGKQIQVDSIKTQKKSGRGTCVHYGSISTLYESTPLIVAYFSQKNVENLQNLLKYAVYREIKMVIDTQSKDELVAVMQSIYIMNVRHPQLPGKIFEKKLQREYTLELLRLNEITVRTMLPHIISDIQQHIDYIRDISNPTSRMYLDNPISDNIKGEREYSSITKIFTGIE